MFSNREIAALVIFGVVIVCVMFNSGVRRSIAGALKAFRHWKLQLIILLYATYAVGAVLAAAILGAWELALLKDTIIWIIFSSLPVLLRAARVEDGPLLVKRTLVETFGVSVIVGFYVNLGSFSLLEVGLYVILFCLVGLGTAAARGDNTRSVANVASFLITATVLALLWTTTSWLVRNWESVDQSELWLSAAMTLWIPLALLPFIYGVAFTMRCQWALKMVKFVNDSRSSKLGVCLGVLVSTRGSVRYASSVTGRWRAELGKAKGFRQAMAVMVALRQDTREEEEAKRQAIQRLRDHAGVKGMDENGRQLDRREFDETQRALSYLWTCMLGHARNQKGKYRRDLLAIVDDFSRFGLPEGRDHGITLEVVKDRRAWFAWRRTVTGWVFAIGGNRRDRTIQWIYDGAEPPSEFPGGKNSTWCDGVTSSAAAPNWGAASDIQDVA